MYFETNVFRAHPYATRTAVRHHRPSAELDVREPDTESHGETARARADQVRELARRAAAGDQVVRRGAAVHTDPAAAVQGGVQAAGEQVPDADQGAADRAEEVQAPVGSDQEQAAGREGETFRSAGGGGEHDQAAG